MVYLGMGHSSYNLRTFPILKLLVLTFLFFLLGSYKLQAEVNASIAIGANHSVILKTNGSLWSVGNNSKGQLGDGTTNDQNFSIQIISADVTNISTGNTHTLFIKSDNSLWGIGNNS